VLRTTNLRPACGRRSCLPTWSGLPDQLATVDPLLDDPGLWRRCVRIWLQQRGWTADDGGARSVVEVVVDELGPS